MGVKEGRTRDHTLAMCIASMIFVVGGEDTLEWSQHGSSLREACANAFDFGDPTCQGNSTLYWGTGNGTDLSCAHCVCGDGWGGLDCGRCLDVSVCPPITVEGKTLTASNCSSDTLLLTDEEASSALGKVFSCSCGGGDDSWTGFLCDQQPDTWIQWAVTGNGMSDDDPASVSIKEFAGIHARTEETWPGQYKYHYPKIFEGSASACKVYRDKCLPVDGTDVGNRDCVIFECDDTEGVCPPDDYPMCDGFPRCKSPSGKRYVTQFCTAAPLTEQSITIACQEEKVNGSYVCYYQQPGGFAPMSMTCSVGSCLYQGGTPVKPSGSKTKRVPWSTGVQMLILLSLAGLLLVGFAVFSVVSDPGTATTLPKSFASRSRSALRLQPKAPGKRLLENSGSNRSGGGEGEEWGDQELSVPLLGSNGGIISLNGDNGRIVDGAGRSAHVPRAALLRDDGDSFRYASIDDPITGSGRAFLEQQGLSAGEDGEEIQQVHDARRPAVLRWTKLGYFVKGNGGDQNPDGELTVLRGVSGFAGPTSPDLRCDPSSSSESLTTNIHTSYHFSTRDRSIEERSGAPANRFPGGILPCAGESNGAPGSTMTGILGPSGAGKSSLLDLLAGRKRSGEGRATGSISLSALRDYNGGGRGEKAGTGMEGSVQAVRRASGYVSQEDVLPGTLTCYEHLMFHARLRMHKEAGFGERRMRVLRLLEEFGLRRVADSRIGDELQRGLSGGERRRLSIAAELVASPALLFLDEPTTGLDAATALRVMTLLNGVASRGTTILCSLHQPRPRVFNQLDRVILLSNGRVAYAGPPAGAEAYFSSVGRPFPPGQPHPADAMLALCCREDGVDLPALFRRSRMYADSVNSGALGIRGSREEGLAAPGTGSAAASGSGEAKDEEWRRTPTRLDAAHEHPRQADQCFPSVSASPGDTGDEQGDDVNGNGGQEGTELVQVVERSDVARGWKNLGSSPGRDEQQRIPAFSHRGRQHLPQLRFLKGGGAGGTKGTPAPFMVQVEALSRRLLLRAIRHPLLLVLHFGGSVAMALCLASVFGGRLEFTLEGAQNRFGALFFILLYLSLLCLTSLPVWREDRRLFLTETMGGAYGHVAYFVSVVLVDVLLIRVLPPLAFAVVGYPLMGLNSAPDNRGCLLWFAGILVLTNVTVALAAMGVGALGLPLDLSNLIGGLMVLVLAAFGRFLLNGTRIPWGWRWLSWVTPLGYAFEALLINEFTDEDSSRPYRIEGSHCSPGLPLIEAQGPQILSTFSFSPERSTRRLDTALLGCLALALMACSLSVFFFATRTKPLAVERRSFRRRNSASSGLRRTRFVALRPAEDGRGGHPEGLIAKNVSDAKPEAPSRGGSPPRRGWRDDDAATSRRRTRRTVTWNVPGDEAPSHGGRECIEEGSSRRRRYRQPAESAAVSSRRGPDPLLLSWEGLKYSVPAPAKRRFFRSGERGKASETSSRAEGLVVLDGVSGFAGAILPKAVKGGDTDGSDAANAFGGSEEEGATHLGTVTAIMGPSGAGKTSLLNALAGRLVKATEGTRCFCGGSGGECGKTSGLSGVVRINGAQVSAAVVRRLSAYVTQEDVLPETLTCHEHLMFHAHLRLPSGTSPERRRARVSEVLEELGLSGVCDSRVGGGLSRGISGGEKRRLSIGTELLTRPALLFLDEPTTGLDSSTALRVMKVVADVAARGTTVLCSVHQPRPAVVQLFDRLILLSRGAVAFAGAPEDAESYFASIGRDRPFLPLSDGIIDGAEGGNGGRRNAPRSEINPADAMLDAVGEAEALDDRRKNDESDHGEKSGLLVAMPLEIILEQVRAVEASAPPPPPLVSASVGNFSYSHGQDSCGDARRISPPLATQLSALLRRSALNVTRDPYLAGLHMVLTVCVGFVLGSLFGDLNRLNKTTAGVQDRLGVVFLLLLYLSLLCLTSLAAWRKQMSLFVHERASGAYGAVAHLTTAVAVDAVACRILPPFLLAATVRPLSGLREGSMAGLVGGLVAFNLSLAGVLAACGAASKSSQEALAMGCLMVLFSALLSGFLVAKDDLPAGWEVVAWASPIGRGFEALIANEFGPYGTIFRLSTKIGTAVVYSDYMTGNDVLRCFGFDGGEYWFDLGVLMAVGACGLALALLFLQRSR